MLDLESIELIKQLKARYFRGIDTADIELLRQVFTADANIHFLSTTYDIRAEGWPELEAFYRGMTTPTKFGMHHGHLPEIEVDGDEAHGIWYLQDIFYNFEINRVTQGTAFYHDDYRREDGRWRIRRSRYQRHIETVSAIPERLHFTVKPPLVQGQEGGSP